MMWIIANVPPMDIEITEISHITTLPSIFMYSYIIRELKVTCLSNARSHPNMLLKLYFLFSEFQLSMENWKN